MKKTDDGSLSLGKSVRKGLPNLLIPSRRRRDENLSPFCDVFSYTAAGETGLLLLLHLPPAASNDVTAMPPCSPPSKCRHPPIKATGKYGRNPGEQRGLGRRRNRKDGGTTLGSE